MEAQLREYRALRRRKELVEKAKSKLETTQNKIVNFLVPNIFRNMNKETTEDEVLLMEEETQPKAHLNPIQPDELDPSELASEASDLESFDLGTQESWKYFILKWSLYTIIWVSLYIYFIILQFGAVFFVISLLIGIYLNTRTRPKKKGEVSAYSVFNDNCASIHGTLNAEKLQKEMIYGIGGARMM